MHRGRPPSAKTLVDRQLGRNVQNPILPTSDGYVIPNLDGVQNHPGVVDNFVPYTGANANVDLGVFNLVTTGNVGIGTTSPGEKISILPSRTTTYLDHDHTTWADVFIRNNVNTDNTAAGIGFISKDADNANAACGIACLRDDATDRGAHLVFITRPSSAISEERMRIDKTGNVGIGTTNPSSILHLRSTNNQITIEDSDDSQKWRLSANVGSFFIIDGSGSTVPFTIEKTAPTDSLHIDDAGKVGIGEATPLAKLHIDGGVGSLATGLAFGDGDTGFFEDSDDVITIQLAGDRNWAWDKGADTFQSLTSKGIVLRRAAGDKDFPTYTFKNDENTGMFSAVNDTLGLSVGGTLSIDIDSSGNIAIPKNLATTGTQNFTGRTTGTSFIYDPGVSDSDVVFQSSATNGATRVFALGGRPLCI